MLVTKRKIILNKVDGSYSKKYFNIIIVEDLNKENQRRVLEMLHCLVTAAKLILHCIQIYIFATVPRLTLAEEI